MTAHPHVPPDLFTAIDHVGVAVPDLDAALEFYAATFGLYSVHVEENEEQGVREAMLAVSDSGSSIQLLAPLREDSPIARFLERKGQGIQQLAYRVSDLDRVSQVLRDRGLRLLYPEARRGTANSRVNFVHPKDAGGVLVELVEPAAGSIDAAPAAGSIDAAPAPGSIDAAPAPGSIDAAPAPG